MLSRVGGSPALGIAFHASSHGRNASKAAYVMYVQSTQQGLSPIAQVN